MIATGQIPIRFEGAPGSELAGRAAWRGVKDFEHATLCAAFNLDPVRFYFDLPSSCRMVGSNSSGNRGRRTVNGFIMQAGVTEPVGKLAVCWAGERFKDVDPTNKEEFYKL